MAEHQDLFRSGAYVSQFQPDTQQNPFRTIYGQKRDALLRLIAGTDRDVLDVGGGPGRISIPLSARHRVTLCDLSPEMLRLARSASAGRLGLCLADANRLPFADAKFDFVLGIDLLPHLPRPESFFSEARRVLRPQGRLLVDSTNGVPLWTLAYPRYVGRNPARWIRTWRAGGVLPEWSSRVVHLRRARFLALLAASGFHVQQTLAFGPPFCPKWHLAVAAP